MLKTIFKHLNRVIYINLTLHIEILGAANDSHRFVRGAQFKQTLGPVTDSDQLGLWQTTAA